MDSDEFMTKRLTVLDERGKNSSPPIDEGLLLLSDDMVMLSSLRDRGCSSKGS